AAHAERGRALRLPAARGVRRPAPRGDGIPDRVSDGRAAAGMGGRDAGAAAADAARPPARPATPAARDDPGRRAAVVGRPRQADGGARVRQAVGRAAREWQSSRGGELIPEKLRIAVLSPVWFPVPPTGYGGIEWIVSLLADGLVAAGHETTL